MGHLDHDIYEHLQAFETGENSKCWNFDMEYTHSTDPCIATRYELSTSAFVL